MDTFTRFGFPDLVDALSDACTATGNASSADLVALARLRDATKGRPIDREAATAAHGQDFAYCLNQSALWLTMEGLSEFNRLNQATVWALKAVVYLVPMIREILDSEAR